ncbi:MAG: aminotransferase class I/II-fold pyridoxal phosphate-dependent enzyme [Bacteroidota bacterium]|nr:aminotransferase class I/II-fold pyridoxal phosphate-dependent enzyme [Bacteroidota bacterium]
MSIIDQPDTLLRAVAVMADTLIPSEIIKLANDVNQKINKGESIHNLTIGDFDPSLFPIPKELTQFIINAYLDGHTNYPAANGIPELRIALASYIKDALNLEYTSEEILISGGARPLIYAIYKTIVDPGDRVIYAVPSWNNNHYCHLCEAVGIPLNVGAEQNFMPTREDIEPHIQEAVLIALCSPQNPTGTVFSRNQLLEISELVLKENRRRKGHQKPLYILYDQIYWQLTFGKAQHEDPVSLVPELRDYVIYVDGLSKVFAATGVRVGWSFGPKHIIDKMRAILSHIGAWAPKAEQVATAKFIENRAAVNHYLSWFKPEIKARLFGLYEGMHGMKEEGYALDVISPQASIYLTVRFPWKGKRTAEGAILKTQSMVTQYILDQCKLAIVPFKAFGTNEESDWYRISVGTLKSEVIPKILEDLKKGMDLLK